ncbi:alpha-L-arabinofuranosidase C-terminal domain-containing protein [Streptomyces sp. NPDC005921]
MLSPRTTPTRDVVGLDGLWRFALGTRTGATPWTSRLATPLEVPVPASYNDLFVDAEIRDHVGVVWYQRDVRVPRGWTDERVVLRFGAVTHAARVYADDRLVAEHTGGYTPFEADLTGIVEPGTEFRLTVAVDNRLTNVTIPPGTVTTGPDGHERQSYLHDFYNYAGIARSVRLYSTPKTFVEDVTVVTGRDGAAGTVAYRVEVAGEHADTVTVRVRAVDEAGRTVAEGHGTEGVLRIEDVTLWRPGAAYLYDLVVEPAADGETGHKTAAEYGRLAAETARAMRQADPGLELVACGSSSSSMPTFASWESTVLQETYDLVDHVSLHAYYEEIDGDRASFLASAVDMEHFIESVVATCDHVRARLKATKRINLSFDEWNVWYQQRPNPHPVEEWQQAPRLLEDVYTVTDAVVFGSLLIALLRHADRVTAASLAQLVNVIAPIMTEPGGSAWRQTTFHPFAQASAYGRGRVLQVEVDSPVYPTARFGEVPLLHATAVTDDGSGDVTVFAVNRGQATALPLEIDLRGVEARTVVEHLVLADADPEAHNTADQPDRVTPRGATGTTVEDGVLRAELEPLSWNMIRLVRPQF